ncbi:unnamed protein product [Ectocarpus sp. 13 AM-2016]
MSGTLHAPSRPTRLAFSPGRMYHSAPCRACSGRSPSSSAGMSSPTMPSTGGAPTMASHLCKVRYTRGLVWAQTNPAASSLQSRVCSPAYMYRSTTPSTT